MPDKPVSLLLVVLTALLLAMPASASQQPNIVFVLIDDLRYDALGAEGHPYVQTPAIDNIARDGIRFERFFVSNPICSPSRATILTGQYALTNGIVNNKDNSAESHTLQTFAIPIRAAGYRTAFFGKWHMGKDATPRPGWDHWIAMPGQGEHDDPILNFNGEERRVEGYMTDLLSRYVVEFIEQTDDRPFLVYLGHKSVHGPYIPADRHDDLYADREIARNPAYYDDLAGKPMLTPNINPELTSNMTADDFSPQAMNQLRMMNSVDEGMARIVEALKSKGELDNTVIVLTSDNGYSWGEHRRRGKRMPYEQSIRVPLYLSWPAGIEGGQNRSQLVLNTDIAPTLIELAGARQLPGNQGKSFVPLLEDPDAAGRDIIYLDYLEPRRDHYLWHGVRTERWKYVRYYEHEDMEELYDLRADPWELTNLVREPELQDTVEELRAELDRLAKAAGAD